MGPMPYIARYLPLNVWAEPMKHDYHYKGPILHKMQRAGTYTPKDFPIKAAFKNILKNRALILHMTRIMEQFSKIKKPK